MKSKLSTYTVIYRVGGTENCEWRRALPVMTYTEALDKKHNLEMGGRKAIIHLTSALNVVGMPTGWEA